MKTTRGGNASEEVNGIFQQWISAIERVQKFSEETGNHLTRAREARASNPEISLLNMQLVKQISTNTTTVLAMMVSFAETLTIKMTAKIAPSHKVQASDIYKRMLELALSLKVHFNLFKHVEGSKMKQVLFAPVDLSFRIYKQFEAAVVKSLYPEILRGGGNICSRKSRVSFHDEDEEEKDIERLLKEAAKLAKANTRTLNAEQYRLDQKSVIDAVLQDAFNQPLVNMSDEALLQELKDIELHCNDDTVVGGRRRKVVKKIKKKP